MNQRRYFIGRYAAIAAVAVTLLAVAVDYWPATVAMSWRTFDDAMLEAQRTNKLVFVDVTASWCAPCRMMDRTVFSDDSVRMVLNERYVPVRINGDDTITGKPIIHRYAVKGYPTCMILTPTGGVVRRVTGFQPRNTFLAWLQDSSVALLSRWAPFETAREFAQRHHRRLLLVVLKNASMVPVVSNYFDNDNVRRIIDSLYIPTLLAQELPGDAPALKQLGYADFPLSDDMQRGFGRVGLLVILDERLREQGRVLLERAMLEDIDQLTSVLQNPQRQR